jgi:predicted secreted protein
MVTHLVLCVIALAVLAGGCGEEAPREGGAEKTAPAPRAAPRTITEVDSGESFTLSRGSETRLRLSGDYVWSEPTVRGDAVELTRVDYLQDPGFSEWTIVAARPGTATIAARGTPDCAGEARCPDEPLRFQTEITVAP